MPDDATPEPIDFSALDPSSNQLHWERTINRLATQGSAECRRRLSIQHQLLRWGRPVLAAAAALCLIAWTAGYWAAARQPTSSADQGTAPALSMSTWAANHEIPDTSELLGALRSNP
jgi:hypothetical protein